MKGVRLLRNNLISSQEGICYLMTKSIYCEKKLCFAELRRNKTDIEKYCAAGSDNEAEY